MGSSVIPRGLPLASLRTGHEEDGVTLTRLGEHPLSEQDLSSWLEVRASEVADRWSLELRARTGREGPLDSLRDGLLHAMTGFLGPAVGPWRDQVEPLLHQVAALYGNVASLRGLAAGDVVEEVQVLREILLRFLFRDSGPQGGVESLGLRGLLRLSRVVDQMVTHANVGHIDALFFNLLHGTGVTEFPGEELLEEIREELALLEEELAALRALSGDGAALPRN
jgi:hypothetical protein